MADETALSGPSQHDLAVPTYIDTGSLLDLLASLEGGFSMVERFTSQADDASSKETEAKGEVGVSNVLSLLKLNLSGSRKAASSSSASSQVETERYHTYGSLLYRLRATLDDAGLIKRVPDTEWADIAPSDFIEVRGVFRPNPLAESLSTVLRMLGIISAVLTIPDKPDGGANRDAKQRANEARAAGRCAEEGA